MNCHASSLNKMFTCMAHKTCCVTVFAVLLQTHILYKHRGSEVREPGKYKWFGGHDVCVHVAPSPFRWCIRLAFVCAGIIPPGSDYTPVLSTFSNTHFIVVLIFYPFSLLYSIFYSLACASECSHT